MDAPSPDDPPARPSSSETFDAANAETRALHSPTADARHFHHYEICLREDGVTLHELGRGAMGVSYKARDVNLDTPVAIKVISADLPAQSQARERFRREARAAARLRHPNVASVFHFGETPTGHCFYAMEFIEGETLAARVQREGPLPPALVIEIALQVTAALIAADERGLVHRDLKPANIMLTTTARTRPLTRSGSAGSSPAQQMIGEGDRLRPRQSGGRRGCGGQPRGPAHAGRRLSRHPGLCQPRTGRRRRRGRALGHLQSRRDAVVSAHRPGALSAGVRSAKSTTGNSTALCPSHSSPKPRCPRRSSGY